MSRTPSIRGARHRAPTVLLALLLAAGGTVRGATQELYRVRFTGVPSRWLRPRLIAVSDTVALRRFPPPTDGLLLRRAEADLPRIAGLLRSQGYLTARATAELRATTPREIRFRLHAGPRYRLGRVTFVTYPLRPPKPSKVGLDRHAPAESSRLLAAEQQLLDYVRSRGHPYPIVTNRLFRAMPDSARLEVTLAVDPGPSARFGPVRIEGTQTVDDEVVRHALLWRAGSHYDASTIAETRAQLIRSRLFASVDVTASNEVPPDGLLPLTVSVRERLHRTVEAGASYHTDVGAAAKLLWENRNLDSHAERLSAVANLGQEDSSAELAYRRPRLARQNQTLISAVDAARETSGAYNSDHVRGRMLLARTWSPDWQAEAGLALHYLSNEEQDEPMHQTLLSTPLSASWGRSDDWLDPGRGLRIALTVQPFAAVAGDASQFVKSEIGVQNYQPLDSRRRRVLATRLRAGGIIGEQRLNLPVNERFYAGGGNSIRGYAYQTVGPYLDDEPVGGRSVIEFSSELRLRLTTRTGAVAFVDAGSAYGTQLPNLSDSLFWGTGLGFRYYTPIGPLRADVAVPLNRREDIDRSFQVYISIGQAF
ncbi:MAG: BamA/TamA family outer membrane protein [Kiritimatiellae bacterium]|nr:BamA/TamA family outer membrane protein [Kiritimatiellia bacterium]